MRKKAVRLIRILRVQGLIDRTQERQALDAVGATKTPALERTRVLTEVDDDEDSGDAVAPALEAPVTSPREAVPDDGGATAPY